MPIGYWIAEPLKPRVYNRILHKIFYKHASQLKPELNGPLNGVSRSGEDSGRCKGYKSVERTFPAPVSLRCSDPSMQDRCKSHDADWNDKQGLPGTVKIPGGLSYRLPRTACANAVLVRSLLSSRTSGSRGSVYMTILQQYSGKLRISHSQQGAIKRILSKCFVVSGSVLTYSYSIWNCEL